MRLDVETVALFSWYSLDTSRAMKVVVTADNVFFFMCILQFEAVALFPLVCCAPKRWYGILVVAIIALIIAANLGFWVCTNFGCG